MARHTQTYAVRLAVDGGGRVKAEPVAVVRAAGRVEGLVAAPSSRVPCTLSHESCCPRGPLPKLYRSANAQSLQILTLAADERQALASGQIVGIV